MSDKRRNFLKLGFLGGLGLVSNKAFSGPTNTQKHLLKQHLSERRLQPFNMCGYKAPKIDTVRIAIIGIGNRGSGAINRLKNIDNVEIRYLCDIEEDRVKKGNKILKGTKHHPKLFYGKTYSWKDLMNKDDIDLVYITTNWEWHTPMATYSMEQGKHVAVEVPAAKTIDECWQLVETSERTKKHCMMLENCCYDFFELLTLTLARQGYFGDIVHGEGAYIHNLMGMNFGKKYYQNMWRLKENATRNGNLYPTHGLGPICQIMDINRGDQMDYLTSVSSNDFSMKPEARELATKDDFFSSYTNYNYRGNMNTTIVKTKKGRTIMIQHDVSSNRPYSRIHLVAGTKRMAKKWPGSPKISKGHEWLSDKEMKELKDKYTPEIVHKIGDLAKKVGGHGGMDFMMDWRLIDCLRNGLPLDQDVYDAALWSSISPLSEWSVANRGDSVDVPDFTRNHWKTNTPVNITLEGGGNTGVVLKK